MELRHDANGTAVFYSAGDGIDLARELAHVHREALHQVLNASSEFEFVGGE